LAVSLAAPLLAAAIFYGGCKVGGVVGIMATPGYQEGSMPAEYNLRRDGAGKVLVLATYGGWVDAGANLRYYLTYWMNRYLGEKARLPDKRIIAYEHLVKWRSARADSADLAPAETAKALGADRVLVVEVGRFELSKMPGTDYYSGFLAARASLLDGAGQVLWPASGEGRIIRVGFEVEPKGRQAAVARLATACAHCVTRHFYDCPKKEFKIFEEQGATDLTSVEQELR
jgi:hypothetical protein